MRGITLGARVGVLAALVGAGACARDRGVPPMPGRLAAPPAMRHVDREVMDGARATVRDLARAAREGDGRRLRELLGEDGELRELIVGAVDAGLEVSVEAAWDAVASTLGGAAVTSLSVRLRTRWGGELDLDRWDGLVHVAATERGWRVRESLPWVAVAASRLERVDADVWVDPAREWVSIDARLDVAAGGGGTMPIALELPPHVAPGRAPLDTSPRVRLVEVSQDGVPCAFQSWDEVLLVELATPAPRARLRLRYEGEIATDVDQFVRDPRITTGDQVHLLRALPRIEGSVTAHEVVVHHPALTDVVGPAPAVERGDGPDGWRWARIRAPSAGTFLIYVTRQRALPTQTLALGGLQVEIAGWFDGLEGALGDAAHALAPLGAWPSPAVRFVSYQRPHEAAPEGELAGQTILLDWSAVTQGGDERVRLLATHELAHLWFGGAVPIGGRDPVWWWESVASYVALWALGEEERAGLTAAWGARVRDLETGRTASAGDARSRSYFQGALVLVLLERRIGKDALAAALRAFVAERAGQPSGWAELTATIDRETGQGAWLRDALTWDGPRVANAMAQARDVVEVARLGGAPEPARAATAAVVATEAPLTEGAVTEGAASGGAASGGAASAPSMPPPIALPDAIVMPAEAEAAREAAEAILPGLDQALAPRAGQPRELAIFAPGTVVPAAEAYWRELVNLGYATLSTEASDLDFALGGRHVGILRIADAARDDRESRLDLGAFHFDGAHLVPGLPWDLVESSRTLAVTGSIWIDPSRQWITGDVTVRIATAPAATAEPLVMRFAPIRTPTDGDGWQHRGVRVTDITQDGDGCPYQAYRDLLVVRPIHAARELTLRIRYQGELDALPDDWTALDEVHLGRAFPIIDGSAPSIDAVVHAPEGASIEGPRPATTRGDGPDGWRWARFRADAAAAMPLHVRAAAARVREVVVDAPGVRVTVAAAGDPGAHGTLAPLIAPVLEALAPLGPPPVRAQRVVATGRHLSDQPDGRPAALGETIFVPWTAARATFASPAPRHLAARSLARLWFGGVVPPGGHAAGAWWDAVAGYVGLWALLPEEARAVRQGWIAALSATRAKLPSARYAGTVSPAVAGLLSHAAGPLALVTLEDRIGRDAMIAALRTLLATRRGRPSTWDDLLAAIAGAAGQADADWLRDWLDTPGVPDLELRDVRLSDNRLRFDLVQFVDHPFRGAIDVALYRGDYRVGGGRVRFAAETLSTVLLDAPTGVDRVVLDPEARTLHRIDPMKSAVAAGTEVAIDAAATAPTPTPTPTPAPTPSAPTPPATTATVGTRR